MSNPRVRHWSRREFFSAAALAGTSALLGLPSESTAAEAPPETTRIRLVSIPGVCVAPQYVSEELLRVDARLLVDKGYSNQYDYALQSMKEMGMGYGKWRNYDPEDTLRFYALRMNEVGMIASTPQKIIAQGTDWRFLRELKKELKG